MKKFFSLSILAFTSLMLPLSHLLAELKATIEIPYDEERPVPVLIIGGGIGALTSALYLARAGVEPLVIEGNNPGGLLTQSHSVQNWPGELEIEGGQLTDRVKKQAEHNGARFRREEVIGVDFSKRPFVVTTRSVDDKEKIYKIEAESCIIAMGTQPNFLGVPGEVGADGYWGRGVTNCAVCDGNLYRGRKVGVVGGGDAAVLEALYLANIAKEVHVFVRKDTLRAFEEKRIQTLLEKPNVKIHYNTRVEAIQGDGEVLTHVLLKSGSKKSVRFDLDGLFLAIGSTPNTKIFKGVLDLDEKGYILLKKDQQTSVTGVYAIGDIVDPVYKQAISASGDGAKAALQAQQYISDRVNGLAVKRGKNPKIVVKNDGFDISAGGLAAKSAKNQEIVAKSELLAVRSTNQDGQVIEIRSKEQIDQEIRGDIPTLVDFYASWCGPCKAIAPLIDSSAAQLAGKVKFLKVNVDKNYDLSRTYDIRAMPTVILFDTSGSVIDRRVGGDQISNLLNKLKI